MPTNDVPDIPLVDWEEASAELDAELKATSKTRGRRPRAARAPRKDKVPLQPWRAGAIAAHVTRLHMLGAMGLDMRGMHDWAEVTKEVAEPAGRAWEKVAKRHEWLRRFFEWTMSTSDIGELIGAYMPLMMLAAGKAGLFGKIAEEVRAEMQNEMSEATAA